MLYWLGTAAFALAILISVSLHELGHMLTAKRFGMKVTQYFVGFGPTIFSFKRGETEYGLKAIPLGGFCKITGMTPQDDDVSEADQPRAMWRFPVWKRTIVMGAGSFTHFCLALVATWIAAVSVGLPNPDYPQTTEDRAALPARVNISDCVPTSPTATACSATDPKAPSAAAGLRDGDLITKVGGTAITSYGQLAEVIRSQTAGTPIPFEYQRDGVTSTTNVTLVSAEAAPLNNPDGTPTKVSFAGVTQALDMEPMVTYGPGSAFGASFEYSWSVVKASFAALGRIPEKVPALWHSITGSERDPDTPISVVGASRLGGEAIEAGVPEVFLMIFISLNIFIGLFNLLPLLPVDGGHIAIAWYERIRSWIYARLKKPDPGRVDYYKLMPLTYAVILVGGAFTLLTITADVVNPISIFSR